jgi:excisionase family DNA binding protein
MPYIMLSWIRRYCSVFYTARKNDMDMAKPTDEYKQRLLKVDEVAQILGISKSLVYEMIANGELTSVRYRGILRVPTTVVEDWIKQHTTFGGN